jgi:hypothetical protein
MIERGKIDTPYPHTNTLRLSGLGTGYSMKGGRVKLDFQVFSHIRVKCQPSYNRTNNAIIKNAIILNISYI